MKTRMKPLLVILFAAFLPLAAGAQDAPFAPVPASEVVLADLLFLKRAVVVFADSPNDPNYIRQMELLARDTGDLIERDVILITDTTPKPPSELRQTLHPRGFSLVILDKDGKPDSRGQACPKIYFRFEVPSQRATYTKDGVETYRARVDRAAGIAHARGCVDVR